MRGSAWMATALCVLALAAAPAAAETCKMTQKQAMKITTAKKLMGMGGRRLTGAEIQAELVGVMFDEGSWTWIIKPDKTHVSVAADKSWTSSGKWKIKGDQYCRNADEAKDKAFNCSDVYEICGWYKFTKDSSTLANWTVRRP